MLRLDVEVDSNSPMRRQGHAVRAAIESFIDPVVIPVLAAEGCHEIPWPSIDPGDVGTRIAFETGVTGKGTDGKRLVTGPLSEADWSTLLDRLGNGAVRDMYFALTRPVALAIGGSIGIAHIDLNPLRVDKSDPDQLMVGISTHERHATIVSGLQPAILRILRDLATSLPLSTGYVAGREALCASGPGIDIHGVGTDSRNHLRGLGWGTLLSSRHVTTLGGIDRVFATAPVHDVQRWTGPDGDLLFLQATPSMLDVSLDIRDRLGAYLRPLFASVPKRS